MPQDITPLITQIARKYKLDPIAVLAVARGEGGTSYGAVGDGGHAHGPFQLNDAGGVLTGRPGDHAAFANSPQGLEFALAGMARAGAAGLTGQDAVRRIISNYERPADKATSIRNALARLGGGGYTGAAAAPPASAPTPTAPAENSGRQALLSLLAQRRSGSTDRTPVLAALTQMRQSQATPVPAAPARPTAAPAPTPAQPAAGGFQPDFASRLDQLVAASGGRLKVTSGYRSPEHQAELYAAALKKYGSEKEARRWVAPPGKSNHNKGLAADLGGDLAWAHANAARFGLYFPLSNESWHVEMRGSRG